MRQRHHRIRAESRSISGISIAAMFALLALVVAAFAPSGANAAEGSSISIVVWQCPPATTPGAVSLADCENVSGGTTFTLTSGSSPMSMTWTTGTIEGSGGSVDGIQPGTYSVKQERPGAFESFWRCGRLGESASPAVPAYTEGDTIEIEIVADGEYRCDWILVPSNATPVAELPDGVGTVVVVAHLCPSTVSQSSSYDELTAACSEPPEGVSASFSAWDNPPTSAHGMGTSYDDSGTAELIFDELPAGPIVVVETIPEGYGDPVVYCTDMGDVGAGEPKSYTERIQWVLQDDVPLTCHFFNFPA